MPSSLRKDVVGAEEAFTILGPGMHQLSCEFYPAEWPPKPIIAPYIIQPGEIIA